MTNVLFAHDASFVSDNAVLAPVHLTSLEGVINKIHERAKLGYRSIPLEKLHITVVEKIKYLGYNVTEISLHFGEEVTVEIKW
jgi:hypothetical protein